MTQSNISQGIFTPSVTDTAFEKILAEIAAVPDEESVAISIDVVSAASTVLGRVQALNRLRPQLVDELPRFDIARFDKLETYALALIHVHGLHRGAQMEKGDVTRLGTELTAIRDRFYSNAKSLAENGLLDASRLKECKTAIGYRATASDILTLVPLFKEYWQNIEGKTPITPAALTDATNRAAELLSAVGLRTQSADVTSEKAELRTKAYTLLLRAYEDARHAIQFIRREEKDADELAPSLFAGRGGRRREDDDDAPAPNKAPTAGAGGAAPKKGNAEPQPVVLENPEGLPIDSPYTA